VPYVLSCLSSCEVAFKNQKPAGKVKKQQASMHWINRVGQEILQRLDPRELSLFDLIGSWKTVLVRLS